MNVIDVIKINFNFEQFILLNICLAFIMFGVVLDLWVDNFWELLYCLKVLFIGLSLQLILLLLLMIGLIYFFWLVLSIVLGMLLVFVCLGGNVFNFVVYLFKVNMALLVLMISVFMFVVVVIMFLYFIMLVLFVLGFEGLQGDIYVLFMSMVMIIVQLILVFLLIGMGFYV